MPMYPYSTWDSGSRSQALSRVEIVSTYFAVFLAPFATFRFFGLNFTPGDLLFCTSLGLLVLTRGIPRAPLYSATWLWVLGYLIMFVGLFGSSLISGDPARGLLVCLQYFLAYILLMPVIVR